MVAFLQHGCAAEPAGFFGVGHALHGFAADGGIGRNHPQLAGVAAVGVAAIAAQRGGNQVNLVLLQVRSDLDEQRLVLAMLLRKRRAALHQRIEQGIQRFVALQRAQVLGVGAADVYRHIVRPRIDAIQAGQVVIRRLLDRRAGILADVQTQQAAAVGGAGTLHIAHKGIQTLVVEAETVDQRIGLGQAENTRLGVARLTLGRNCSDLDRTEAHGFPRCDAARVLVQTGGQADAVGKAQTAQRYRIVHEGLCVSAAQQRVLGLGQHVDGGFVGGFCIQTEQDGAGQGVGDQGHVAVF